MAVTMTVIMIARLLIDHNRCSAGVDLGQHVGADRIDLLVELVAEGVDMRQRSLSPLEVARFELA